MCVLLCIINSVRDMGTAWWFSTQKHYMGPGSMVSIVTSTAMVTLLHTMHLR